MRRVILLAGVAALGVSTPILAQSHGHGGGRGHQAAAAQHGGGHGKQARAQARQARGNQQAHGNGRQVRVARQQGRGQERRLNAQQRHAERAIQQERRVLREARGDQRRAAVRRMVRQERVVDGRDWRGWEQRRLAAVDRGFENRGRRLAIGPAGCPPGLARQNAYCMPPGQLRKSQMIGQRLSLSSLGYNIPDPYRYRFSDNNRYYYRYGDDGTVYRFDRGSGLVSSVIPLRSSGLFLGEPLPLGYYDVYNVPLAYRNYYPDSRDYMYRYDGNAIYRVNSDNMMVDGIVALLTGGSGGLGALGVGDRLPLGYDVYNVPYDYRDTYYDTPDAYYRYADNSIYQIDPTTQLIQAVISLLV
jgi:hypothetical protein